MIVVIFITASISIGVFVSMLLYPIILLTDLLSGDKDENK